MTKTKKELGGEPSNEVLEMVLLDLITELAGAFDNLSEVLFDVRDRLASPDASSLKKGEKTK